jgi:hypothetical protein
MNKATFKVWSNRKIRLEGSGNRMHALTSIASCMEPEEMMQAANEVVRVLNNLYPEYCATTELEALPTRDSLAQASASDADGNHHSAWASASDTLTRK